MGEVLEFKVGGDWRRDKVGRRVIGPQGTVEVPQGWVHVPPGDPLVTRRIKAKGPAWVVVEQVGRKEFSRGLFAPAELVEKVRAAAERERGTADYQKKLDAGRARREREQADYVRQFHREVVGFLAFPAVHRELAERLAERVTAHATPVGSGTVARTKRIDVDERAEAAVIAWMRHQTTAYDSMHIERVAGRRREVRRELAARSRAVLARYRAGLPVEAGCPLAAALSGEAVVREVEDEVVAWALGEEGEEGEEEGGGEEERGARVEVGDEEEAGDGEEEGDVEEGGGEVERRAGEEPAGEGEVDPRRARMEAVRARMAQRSQVDRKKVPRR